MTDCPLTRTQLRIVGLVADGLSNTEVAGRLKVSEGCVRGHLSRAMSRAGAVSTLQLVLTCARRGWVQAPALTPEDETVWRQRLETRLVAVEERLAEVTDDRLTPALRAYLTEFDRHLQTRHWDEAGLNESRARMRRLIERITSPTEVAA